MLSIPRTISKNVKVNKATQAFGLRKISMKCLLVMLLCVLSAATAFATMHDEQTIQRQRPINIEGKYDSDIDNNNINTSVKSDLLSQQIKAEVIDIR